MSTQAIGFCLDSIASTLYALNQSVLTGGQAGIWVADATTLDVDFQAIPSLDTVTFSSRLQIDSTGGYLWFNKGTNPILTNVAVMYQYVIATKTPNTFPLAGFSQINDFAIAGSTLYVFGSSWTSVVNHNADVTSTTVIDLGVDFIAAGVTTGDIFSLLALGSGLTVKIASVDSAHQITLAALPLAGTGINVNYTIITPVSLGSDPLCSDTVFGNIVLGNYDPATGSGTTTSTPASAGGLLSNPGLIRTANVNRSTQTLTATDSLNGVFQVSGLTATPTIPIGGQSAFAISSDDGHIYVNTPFGNGIPGGGLNGQWVVFNGISDPSPVCSNAWPNTGAGAFVSQGATLGTNIYGFDQSNVLAVMNGSGPVITQVDTVVVPQGNGGEGVVGDEANDGLWLLYQGHIDFWDEVTQQITRTINLSGPYANITGRASVTSTLDGGTVPVRSFRAFCLDESATHLYVLDMVRVEILVIDAVSGAILKSISLAGIYGSGFADWVIQVHQTTIWLMSLSALVQIVGVPLASPTAPNLLYKIDAVTEDITILDKTADFQYTHRGMIQNGGILYVPGVKINLILEGVPFAGSFDPSGMFFTDNSVDFVAAGVQVNDRFNLTGIYGVGLTSFVINSVTTNQLGLQTSTGFNGTFPYEYQVVHPFSDGSHWHPVVAQYRATSGALRILLQGPAPTTEANPARHITANRQTGEVFVVPTIEVPPGYAQVTGSAYTASTYVGFSGAANVDNAIASSNNGHIHLVTMGSGSYAGAVLSFQSISDDPPTISDPWPGPGGEVALLAADALGTTLYMIDAVQGLYSMPGDGPSILLIDPTIPPTYADPAYSANQGVIGDETNDGLWLLYPSRIDFWAEGPQRITRSIGSGALTASIVADSSSTFGTPPDAISVIVANNFAYALDANGPVIWVFDLNNYGTGGDVKVHLKPVQVIDYHNAVAASTVASFYFPVLGIITHQNFSCAIGHLSYDAGTSTIWVNVDQTNNSFGPIQLGLNGSVTVIPNPSIPGDSTIISFEDSFVAGGTIWGVGYTGTSNRYILNLDLTGALLSFNIQPSLPSSAEANSANTGFAFSAANNDVVFVGTGNQNPSLPFNNRESALFDAINLTVSTMPTGVNSGVLANVCVASTFDSTGTIIYSVATTEDDAGTQTGGLYTWTGSPGAWVSTGVVATFPPVMLGDNVALFGAIAYLDHNNGTPQHSVYGVQNGFSTDRNLYDFNPATSTTTPTPIAFMIDPLDVPYNVASDQTNTTFPLALQNAVVIVAKNGVYRYCPDAAPTDPGAIIFYPFGVTTSTISFLFPPVPMVADSSITADITLGSSLSILADSQVTALLVAGNPISVDASLVADSTFMPLEVTLVAASLFATSSLLGQLHFILPTSSMVANSQITAQLHQHHVTAVSILASSNVTANPTEFFRRHAEGTTGGGSNATGNMRIAGSHRVHPNNQSGNSNDTFVTPVGTRSEPTPSGSSGQAENTIITPNKRR